MTRFLILISFSRPKSMFSAIILEIKILILIIELDHFRRIQNLEELSLRAWSSINLGATVATRSYKQRQRCNDWTFTIIQLSCVKYQGIHATKFNYPCLRKSSRFYGVMAITLDFESNNPSSNLGRTFPFCQIISTECNGHRSTDNVQPLLFV